MTNDERLAIATTALDRMVADLRRDFDRHGGDLSADDVARMVQTLHQDDDPAWIDVMIWSLAVAQQRLARSLP